MARVDHDGAVLCHIGCVSIKDEFEGAEHDKYHNEGLELPVIDNFIAKDADPVSLREEIDSVFAFDPAE